MKLSGVFLILILVIAAASFAAAGVKFSDDFSSATSIDGWTFGSGTWGLSSGTLAGSTSPNTSTSAASPYFDSYHTSVTADIWITAAGTRASMFAFVTSPTDFWQLDLVSDVNQLALTHVRAGSSPALIIPFTIQVGKKYHVQILQQNTNGSEARFLVYVNKTFRGAMKEEATSGIRMGFAVTATANSVGSANFDNVVVK